MKRSLAALAIAASLLGAALPAPAHAEGEALFSALIRDTRIDEISGFAASRRHPGVIWTHNDSGDKPRLYAIGEDGAIIAIVHLRGARHVDWEDLAIVERDGRSLLIVADTGDNGGLRQELAIYAVEEPEQLIDARPEIAWKMRFRWPDGARDTEALAVDHETGDLLLISKKRVPPELFRLPPQPSGDRLETAELQGLLFGIDQPTAEDLERNPVYGRYRSQVTAAEISPDNRIMAVLNYRRVMLYRRGDGESWADAVARPPQVLSYPWLPQAEAIAFTPDGSELLIGSEKLPVPLIRLPVPESPDR